MAKRTNTGETGEQGINDSITPPMVSFIFLIISLIAIIGIGVDIFLRSYNQDHDAKHDIFSVFLLFAVYVTTEKCQAVFSAYIEQKSKISSEDKYKNIQLKITEQSTKISNHISNAVTTVYIGNHEQALAYCSARLKHARRVKDTLFRNDQDLILKGHIQSANSYFEATLDLITNGGTVEVIVSNLNILEQIDLADKIIEYIYSNNVLVRWQLFSIDQGKIPLINMVIFEYDDYREVLYGWNYSNTDDGIVFSSKDEKVIRYFDSLFERIKTISSTVSLKQEKASIEGTNGNKSENVQGVSAT